MPLWILLTVVLLGVSAGLLAAAVALVVSGARGARRRREWEAGTALTDAVVVEVRTRRSWNERFTGIDAGPVYIPSKIGSGEPGAEMPTFAPVVRFTLPDGRTVESETLTSRRPAPAREGETLRVRYRLDAPDQVDFVGVGPGCWGPMKFAAAAVLAMIALAFFGLWFVLVVLTGFRG